MFRRITNPIPDEIKAVMVFGYYGIISTFARDRGTFQHGLASVRLFAKRGWFGALTVPLVESIIRWNKDKDPRLDIASERETLKAKRGGPRKEF